MKNLIVFFITFSFITSHSQSLNSLTNIEKNTTDQTFIGIWAIQKVQNVIQTNPIFRNTGIELHATNLGISIGDSANSIDNVRFFAWYVKDDTLFFDSLHNETRHRIVSALFRRSNDTLILKLGTADKLSGKVSFNQNNPQIILINSSC